MQVRLDEIAERAGVSISTVSRVLNDKPGVNAATRRQVLTAIDVLGYDRPARLRPRVGRAGRAWSCPRSRTRSSRGSPS